MNRLCSALHGRLCVGAALFTLATASYCQVAPAIPQLPPLADPSKTIPISAATDVVNNNVAVDAVLLPYSVSRRIFGTEIAKRYAVIQLVISNHDLGDAMILQSVLLDYSHWLFSGTFSALGQSPGVPDNLPPNQTSNTPFQVASAESRLVRSELQDAQQWTARNWTIRSAIMIGATAVGYQFLFGQNFAQGSNAFNGALVPGLQQLWPDNTQAQINHISDFGFGTNHVIPKNSSDVVVAFFPLDRFITPALQVIFRKAPAAYFNPSEMLVDPDCRATLFNLLRRAGALDSPSSKVKRGKDQPSEKDDQDSKVVANAIMHYEQFKLAHPTPLSLDQLAAARAREMKDLATACQTVPDEATDPAYLRSNLTPKDCFLLTLLNKISLNNIRVIASGIMSVDTSKVPATLTDVQFANDPQKLDTWAASTKSQTATLLGTFLSGAQPSVAVNDTSTGVITAAVFDKIVVDTLKSDDSHLVFTYTLPAKVTPGTKLSFMAVKKAKDGSSNQSAAYPYTVNYTDPDGKAAPKAAAPVPGSSQDPGVAAGPAGAPASGQSSPAVHVGVAAAPATLAAAKRKKAEHSKDK